MDPVSLFAVRGFAMKFSHLGSLPPLATQLLSGAVEAANGNATGIEQL
jgi:hypothetical protein